MVSRYRVEENIAEFLFKKCDLLYNNDWERFCKDMKGRQNIYREWAKELLQIIDEED